MPRETHLRVHVCADTVEVGRGHAESKGRKIEAPGREQPGARKWDQRWVDWHRRSFILVVSKIRRYGKKILLTSI